MSKHDFDFTEIIANIPKVKENRKKMYLRNAMAEYKNIPIIDKDYVIDEDNDEINNQIIEYLQSNEIKRDEFYKYIYDLGYDKVSDKMKTSIQTLKSSKYTLQDKTLDFWVDFLKTLVENNGEDNE